MKTFLIIFNHKEYSVCFHLSTKLLPLAFERAKADSWQSLDIDNCRAGVPDLWPMAKNIWTKLPDHWT